MSSLITPLKIDLSLPWQAILTHTDQFLVTMCTLGFTQETSMVGAFADPDDSTIRTASRDIPLPRHRDGIYTQSIADLQGGMYIAKPNVDVVGMYCVQDNTDDAGTHLPCWTILAETEDGPELARIDLRKGQALIWDNRLWHGREGEVGNRLLIRYWITCPALYEVRP
jgi:hypothetical protein